jgi:hypothetical protein
MSDNVAVAKMRINKVLEALGRGKDGPNYLQSCVWNVVGCGLTLDDWTGVVRASGGSMNSDKASGVLHASLELLALHFGLIDLRRIDALRQESAYAKGILEFLDFMNAWASTAQGGEKTVLGRLLTAAQNRFSRFADVSPVG